MQTSGSVHHYPTIREHKNRTIRRASAFNMSSALICDIVIEPQQQNKQNEERRAHLAWHSVSMIENTEKNLSGIAKNHQLQMNRRVRSIESE